MLKYIVSSEETQVHALGDIARVTFNVSDGYLTVEISKKGTIEVKGSNISDELKYGEILCFFPMKHLIENYIELMSSERFWTYIQENRFHTKLAKILSDLMPVRITEITPPILSKGKRILAVRIKDQEAYYLPITDLSTATKKVFTLLVLDFIFNPKILIVDDIDAFLDRLTLKGLINYLIENRKYTQLILATHSLNTVMDVYESKIRDTKVIILESIESNIRAKTLEIDEAMDLIEKGIDIRLVPPG